MERVTLISLLLKLTSIHLIPNSSLALSPVMTSRRTIVRSRRSRAASNAPTRNDPLAQVASVAHFCGVGLPTIAGCKFALVIMARQLAKGNRLSFASNAGQID